jgi:phosphonopyruvate decarboxylase
MLKSEHVFSLIRKEGIEFFAGVPDSLLEYFCAYVTDHTSEQDHVITANEGNAIAMAAGRFLGTGKPVLVYMQNSGIGNAVNPLMSLADAEVYSLPMMLMIGWRGEPGFKDEPQHVKQGRIMPALLDAMEIPWYTLDADSDAAAVIAQAAAKMRDTMAPVALLVRKGAFEKYKLQKEAVTDYPLKREDAIKMLVDLLGPEDIVVSTTGMTSRELYEYRVARDDGHGNDFLTVGAMGHTASIALGLAGAQTRRRIICLDGDGSVLMHMGALAIAGQYGNSNFIHIVINNGAHDSVGGQPTAGFGVDFVKIALACGYQRARLVSTPEEIDEATKSLLNENGPTLLEIRVKKGARSDLGRPKYAPIENRNCLMGQLCL